MWRRIYMYAFIIFTRHQFIRRKISRLGQIASWAYEMQKIQGTPEFVVDREIIWKHVLNQIVGNYQVFEFGVAQGQGALWWINNSDEGLTYFYGFDRFTGLPKSWRHLPAGTFNNDGTPPLIEDTRVHFLTGDIEDTLPSFLHSHSRRSDFSRSTSVYLFDLYLGEPSMFAMKAICPLLKSGDIIYFDEGYDGLEEGLALQELLRKCEVTLIAANFEACAIRIENIL